MQLVPSSSPQRIGQAELALQNLVQADSGAKDQPPTAMQGGGGGGMGGQGGQGGQGGRGANSADQWAQRANDAQQRRLEPPPSHHHGGHHQSSHNQPHQHSRFFVSPPMPPGGNSPGSTPGDWKCPNCVNINFAFREKCNRCNTLRPTPSIYGPLTGGGGGMGGVGAIQQQQVQLERRICPFTVMLMRVPPMATEMQVAEALLAFGDIAAGGIKFHRQVWSRPCCPRLSSPPLSHLSLSPLPSLLPSHISPDPTPLLATHQQGAKFKQRRGRMPPDGLALHAFCRFLRPSAASTALQRGELLILGQAVQVNPAFMHLL